MMGNGYTDGGAWMWVSGALMILSVLVLIWLVVWTIGTVANRTDRGHNPGGNGSAGPAGRARTKQLLDERYARGELNTDEYTERLHTLGL